MKKTIGLVLAALLLAGIGSAVAGLGGHAAAVGGAHAAVPDGAPTPANIWG